MNNIAARLGSFIQDNSSIILTSVAVSGAIATAVAAARGAVKSQPLVEKAKEEIRKEYRLEDDAIVVLSRQDYVKAVWKAYIPAGLLLGTTVAAIVGGHTVNQRKQALLIGAYSLVDNAYKEFQEKTRQTVSEKQYTEVVDRVAEAKVATIDKSEADLVILAADKQVCMEVWSGRIFSSDTESIRKAENDVNRRAIHDSFASHNTFYDSLGLDHTEMGNSMGWTTDSPMEVYLTAVMHNDRPILGVSFRSDPISEYMRHF